MNRLTHEERLRIGNQIDKVNREIATWTDIENGIMLAIEIGKTVRTYEKLCEEHGVTQLVLLQLHTRKSILEHRLKGVEVREVKDE